MHSKKLNEKTGSLPLHSYSYEGCFISWQDIGLQKILIEIGGKLIPDYVLLEIKLPFASTPHSEKARQKVCSSHQFQPEEIFNCFEWYSGKVMFNIHKSVVMNLTKTFCQN